MRRKVWLIGFGLVAIGFVMMNTNPYAGRANTEYFTWVGAATTASIAGVILLLGGAIAIIWSRVRSLRAK